MLHDKILVVDFDDTLSFTTNRDWDNAKPNIELISKLNSLVDEGWVVRIVTARGQLSCNEDSNLADLKYRDQIESWLRRHGVKYKDLSFQKKLGAYYIDDKGITPEDFVNKFAQTELKGGASGARVVHDCYNNVVHKTASNTQNAVRWFDAAKSYGYRTPTILKVIGDTITMEYINQTAPFSYDAYVKARHVAYSFANHEPIFEQHVELYDMYVDRCVSDRLGDAFTPEQKNQIRRILYNAMSGTYPSFSHGDFSCSNILVSGDNSLVLIDPICDKKLLSSFMIDLSKLSLTYQLANPTEELKISKLELAHWVGHLCRMIPYVTNDRGLYTFYINKTLELIDVL